MAVQTFNVGMTTGKDSVTMPAYGFRIGLSKNTGVGAPSWVFAGADLDVDFGNQRAYNRKSSFAGLPQTLLTISRASGGGRFDSSGNWAWDATNNALRYDYDPVTLAALGVLREEQRTNLLTYSNDLTNAAYTNTNLTVTLAALTLRGIDFQKVQATATATTIGYRIITGVGSASGNSYTVFVKKGSGATDLNAFALRNNTTSTTLVGVKINLDTGGITYTTGSSGCSVKDCGDGIWRVNLTVTSGISAGDNIRIYYANADGASETAGRYVYLAFFQLEAGAFATTYIPTTSAQVTRATDVITLATSSFNFNTSQGTVRAAFDVEWRTTTAPVNWGIVATGNNGRLLYGLSGDGKVRSYDGTTSVVTANAITAVNTQQVAASRYGADQGVCLNGGTVATGTFDGAMASGTLEFGAYGTTNNLNGHLSRVSYWNLAKNDADLQALAT